MISKTSLALKLYFSATDEQISDFWLMIRQIRFSNREEFDARDLARLSSLGIPVFNKRTSVDDVLLYLKDLGEDAYNYYVNNPFVQVGHAFHATIFYALRSTY